MTSELRGKVSDIHGRIKGVIATWPGECRHSNHNGTPTMMALLLVPSWLPGQVSDVIAIWPGEGCHGNLAR